MAKDHADRDAGHGKCGARTRSGGTCGKPAGWGTPYTTGRCKLHGGLTPTHLRAAQAEAARQACDMLGIPIRTDPAEALMQELWETVGNVAFYRALVQQLAPEPVPDTVEEIKGGPQDGEEIVVPGKAGIYAPTFHQSGLATGESKPHILVQLYNHERKHLVDVSAKALAAGVEQRRIELAEQTAASVAAVLTEFARILGLDPGTAKVREAGRAALTLVAGGA